MYLFLFIKISVSIIDAVKLRVLGI